MCVSCIIACLWVWYWCIFFSKEKASSAWTYSYLSSRNRNVPASQHGKINVSINKISCQDTYERLRLKRQLQQHRVQHEVVFFMDKNTSTFSKQGGIYETKSVLNGERKCFSVTLHLFQRLASKGGAWKSRHGKWCKKDRKRVRTSVLAPTSSPDSWSTNSVRW